MLIAGVAAVRNEERYLASALEAVLAQSYRDFTLTVLDDGSTDATPQIIDEFSARDPRIVRAVRPEEARLGKVAAFNAAFAQSRGDVVIFVHGDDLLTRDSFESRVRIFAGLGRESSRALVLGKLKTMSEDPKRDGAIIPRGDRGNPSGPTIAMGRALADEVFPVSESLPSEDLWFWEVGHLRASRVVHLPSVVVNYRIHLGNTGPRSPSFDAASEALGRRKEVFAELLRQDDRFHWSADEIKHLEARRELEGLRRTGRVGAILLRSDVAVEQRLRTASAASPLLHSLRNRFWRQASGW